jgi:DNA polymerase-3 subunit alpha
MDEERADKLWKLIEPFAAYGFNKAHAASYGRVAYQTAYMKANFPAVYMASVLTADSGDVEKIGEIIAECKRMKIPVLPPNINESFSGFTVVKDMVVKDKKDNREDTIEKIRFGLTTIKNFGEGIANSIIEERKKNGKFTSLTNFLDRIKDKNLNKKSLEALIKCGAMDEFGDRGVLLANLEDLLLYNKEKNRMADNQDSLFGGMADGQAQSGIRLKEAAIASTESKLMWEKELLGLYISGHPLDKYAEKLRTHETTIKKIREVYKEGMMIVAAGIVEEIKEMLTKKGERMMFLRIADLTGSIEVVIFPKVYEEFKQFLIVEKCIAIKGRVSMRNDTPGIIAEKVKEL